MELPPTLSPLPKTPLKVGSVRETALLAAATLFSGVREFGMDEMNDTVNKFEQIIKGEYQTSQLSQVKSHLNNQSR